MSSQFQNPECGHWQTDDAPCNCRNQFIGGAADNHRKAKMKAQEDAAFEKLKVECGTITPQEWSDWYNEGNKLPGTRTHEEWADLLSNRCLCHVRQVTPKPCRCDRDDNGTWHGKCTCGQVGQPTDSPFAPSVEDACRAKWVAGRKVYGPTFVGDPLEELYGEYLDALNYFEELDRQGRMTDDLLYARLSTRRLAELVRAEGLRHDIP